MGSAFPLGEVHRPDQNIADQSVGSRVDLSSCADLRQDLHLRNPVELILDGIFNRYRFSVQMVELAERGVERCSLAATGRPGQENNPMGLGDEAIY